MDIIWYSLSDGYGSAVGGIKIFDLTGICWKGDSLPSAIRVLAMSVSSWLEMFIYLVYY